MDDAPYTSRRLLRAASAHDLSRASDVLFDVENDTMKIRALANAIDMIAQSFDPDMRDAAGAIMTLVDYMKARIDATDAAFDQARQLIGAQNLNPPLAA